MDLRVYYRKIRDVESTLTEPYVVIVSLATPDGGKGGVLTEASRHVAAKQIAELRARAASSEEAAAFHAENARKRREHEDLEQIGRLHVTVVPQKQSGKQAKE